MNPLILQLCPGDQPPFQSLCRGVAQAAGELQHDCQTLYLRSSRHPAGADPAASYLNLERPEQYRDSGRALRQWVERHLEAPPTAIIAHRYRSYRVARAAGLPNRRTLVVAHEFGLLKRWQRQLDRLSNGRGVHFAGVSAPVAAELARITGHQIVLPNAMDISAARGALLPRDAARARLGRADHRFTIGVVGRLAAVKRPLLAIKALHALRAAAPDADPEDCELVFVGDGPLREAVTAASQQEPVRLTGFMPDAAAVMSGFDLLLITTGTAEAFGLTALEAMVAGVPVVTVPSPGVEAVLGELALVSRNDSPAAIADTLRAAMRWTPQQRIDWGERALARARATFSLRQLTDQLAGALTVMNPQSRSPSDQG